jgi:integrase
LCVAGLGEWAKGPGVSWWEIVLLVAGVWTLLATLFIAFLFAAAGKTESAQRDVVIMPSLSKLLATHKLASRHSGADDHVFVSATGRALSWRNLTGSPKTETKSGRGLRLALQRAGIVGDGKQRVRWHDLRHTYASLLIAQGADVVFVSRQMGHASPSITLSVYAHLFDGARHADRTRAALEDGFGAMLLAANSA